MEVWNRIKESSGKDIGEIKPDLDYKTVYLWNEYMAIKSSCETLGLIELDAYQRIYGIEFSPWEASVMLELERLRKSHG